jgi:DNA-binding transcriptional LysR family regulator
MTNKILVVGGDFSGMPAAIEFRKRIEVDLAEGNIAGGSADSNADASHLDLDGRLLKLLVVLIEEGSITRAAERLDTTQSAVSHLLAKLRRIVGDPLFVKAGRGVVATAHAVELAGRARTLLDGMHAFAGSGAFDPAAFEGEFVIAANELQRDLLLPPLLARLRSAAPQTGDILQRRLFEDHHVCFYDSSVRTAPATLDEYLEAEHLTVVYETRGPLDIDRHLAKHGIKRRFVALVSNFSGIPPFLRNSPYLVTLPSLLGAELLRGFAGVPPPLPCPPLPMYLVWHRRDHLNPAHRWLRGQVDAVVEGIQGLKT